MAVFVELVEVLALSSMVLLLLLNQALHVVNFLDIDDGDHNEEDFTGKEGYVLGGGGGFSVVAIVNHIRMLSVFTVAGEDLGY
jgi:hypothetical protein